MLLPISANDEAFCTCASYLGNLSGWREGSLHARLRPSPVRRKGEVVDDTNMTARWAAHLNSKKAGPLVCPICKASESFEAKGDAAGPLSDPRFTHATCTECGYSIFFDTEALPPPV
jgi:predicted nucleic-acid-binding Zn-ribbon protein